ncbi:restriction system protein [Arthrobacter sp. UYP6]
MSEATSATTESEVPTWPLFVTHVLRALSAGETLHRWDIVGRAIDSAGLSEAARAETLNTGGLRSEQRLGWAISNLLKAGWVERPARANYRITAAGREWFAQHPDGISDFATARTLFAAFWPQTESRKPILSAADETLVEDIDPIEQIESGINRIHSDVGDALLKRLRESHSDFFEQAVVDLMLRMGYGGAEQRGKRIGGSNDGGVDGVIDQDALGLDRIYV